MKLSDADQTYLNQALEKLTPDIRRPEILKHICQCVECGNRDAGYMVHNELWLEVYRETPRIVSCMRCFSLKLGRPLKLSDFKLAPINYNYFLLASMLCTNQL